MISKKWLMSLTLCLLWLQTFIAHNLYLSHSMRRRSPYRNVLCKGRYVDFNSPFCVTPKIIYLFLHSTALMCSPIFRLIVPKKKGNTLWLHDHVSKISCITLDWQDQSTNSEFSFLRNHNEKLQSSSCVDYLTVLVAMFF